MTEKGEVKGASKDSYCLGFRFTAEEEELMEFHIRRAKVFMMRYGKGREPYSIDKEYYKYKAPENNERTDDSSGNC